MKIQIDEGTNAEELIDLIRIFPEGKIIIENGNIYWDSPKIKGNKIKNAKPTNSSSSFERMGDYLNGVFGA